MNELSKKNLLNLDCMTVTGKTVGENIAPVKNRNTDIIRPIEKPYSETGGIAVLKGNLAPDSCVVKRSAVVPEMLVHEGPARVFDCEEDAIAAILGGKIVAGELNDPPKMVGRSTGGHGAVRRASAGGKNVCGKQGRVQKAHGGIEEAV